LLSAGIADKGKQLKKKIADAGCTYTMELGDASYTMYSSRDRAVSGPQPQTGSIEAIRTQNDCACLESFSTGTYVVKRVGSRKTLASGMFGLDREALITSLVKDLAKHRQQTP
jgi:hypothetical protein